VSLNESTKARYFVTGNRISPFVCVLGEWKDNAALIRSVRAGVPILTREMVEAEHEFCANSTRSTFVYWKSVREMLWTHKSPDLEHVYDVLVQRLRSRSERIRKVLALSVKRTAEKEEQRSRDRSIAELNKLRREPLHERILCKSQS